MIPGTVNKRRLVKDWTSVDGARAEIVQHGQALATGTIDGVTSDGAVAWIQDGSGRRKLYERFDSIEIWVRQEDLGLSYKISKADL